MVRSITQRCFPRLFCGFDATSAMWARMPRLRRLNTDGSVVVGLVGVELERAAAGPGPTPLIGATLSRTSSTSMLSYRFAPESSMWSGRPSPAVRMGYLAPSFPRSVGSAPVRSPLFARTFTESKHPRDRSIMPTWPNSSRTTCFSWSHTPSLGPALQPAPTRDPRTKPQLRRKLHPQDTRQQNEHDPTKRLPIRDPKNSRPPIPRRTTRRNQRLYPLLQLIRQKPIPSTR